LRLLYFASVRQKLGLGEETLALPGDVATVGITDFAAGQLGDVVFVELPDVGRTLAQFAAVGVVESVKAVSDLFAPVGGEVLETNSALAGSPELLNSDPFGAGWMLRLRLSDRGQLDGSGGGRRRPGARPAGFHRSAIGWTFCEVRKRQSRRGCRLGSSMRRYRGHGALGWDSMTDSRCTHLPVRSRLSILGSVRKESSPSPPVGSALAAYAVFAQPFMGARLRRSACRQMSRPLPSGPTCMPTQAPDSVHP